ncbi:MFS transporter [Allostreptomyces psammosilenae]|uniref:YNFM family putative membrane transporter n=1 Tax=Allostreptomyces psammosilenae TaxID=1892865 RepID=A0A853A1J1_9ACTN|nr:MFS transporter [Allostreptomyces psammosilenae]NYI08007.1 YNFM family putative membrane transporter [Allostreptomyces psammosilenae]
MTTATLAPSPTTPPHPRPATAPTTSAQAPCRDPRHRAGSPAFRRVNFALLAAGIATFALLYSTQALLPAISDGLGLSPARASLTVSFATGALALAVIPVSALSERYGRTTVMTVSVFAAAVLGLLVAVAPNAETLLALRALQGVALAGLPATAMAYLAEEVHPGSLAGAMGLYVAGNSIGGMSSRLLTGAVSDAWGWRWALAAVGAVALLAAVAFRLLLPRARNFRPSPVSPRALLRTLGGHLGDPAMRRLYAAGLLLMAVFGAVYNLVGYRLAAAPFSLPETAVGLVFLVYLAGTVTSARTGALTARFGRAGVLHGGVALAAVGILATLSDLLPVVLLGLVLVTAGFFAGHSTASAAVSGRAATGRAQATALYLGAYYLGSSLGGPVAGVPFQTFGWPAVVVFALLALAATAALVPRAALRPGR